MHTQDSYLIFFLIKIGYSQIKFIEITSYFAWYKKELLQKII